MRDVEHLGDCGILMHVALPAAGVGDDEDEQLPEFSLVTGQYRKAKRFGGMSSPISSETSSAIALRNDESALSVLGDSAAGVLQFHKLSYLVF